MRTSKPTGLWWSGLAVCISLVLPATDSLAISADDWREDILNIVGLVEHNHPNPFTKTSRQEFTDQAQQLIADAEDLTDIQLIVQVMTLVASIGDGHTTLHPVDPAGFNRWLPLAFYCFEDGVFIVSAHKDYADLIGARVVGIDDVTVEKVLPRLTGLMGSDNVSGDRANIFYLGSLDALRALGFIEDDGAVTLRLLSTAGEEFSTSVKAARSGFVLNEVRFWGEMYAPLERDLLVDFEIPFNHMNLRDYTQLGPREKPELPLHVRHRSAYWYHYLPESRSFYMQINHVTSAGRGEFESFEAFYEAAFAFVEVNAVEKFILDIRYNSGGDGSILIPFVHKFIRSDKVNRKGQLFTIVGRKTYSAATMLLELMLRHTDTIVVGEPAGSALNSYGDPRSYMLDYSSLLLEISSEYWKLVHSNESPPLTPVDVPAVFSSNDYFSGRDPALDFILALDEPYRTIEEVLAADGANAALERYQRDRNRYGNYSWWRPFDESTFRKVARELGLEGDFQASKIAFEILVEVYPESWRAWRDFGKVYLHHEQPGKALDCLQRALEINAGDTEVQQLVEELS